MKYIILFAYVVLFQNYANAHNEIHGKVLEKKSRSPVYNVYIKILNTENRITYSDQNGRFEFKYLNPGIYYLEFVSMGYTSMVDTVEVKEEESTPVFVYLEEDVLELPEVEISSREEFSQSTISSLDFRLRPHATTQDLLRIVPGLFIAQHAGGGKAEQLFLRGFDIDHGTDVAISVDGMPVNMVSHAHGQGYADLHFVIPETIENMSYSKGPYDAEIGDFNTAGAVKFKTRNFLDKNILKYEYGRFNSHRGLVLLNLIPQKDSIQPKHSAYVAGEYFFSHLYFKEPQDLRRVNVFAKYNGAISHHSNLSMSLSTFASKWDASGQIPQRAVDRGLISWFGSIDPTEGGKTSRSNANAALTTYLHNSAVITHQLYFVDYRFDLFSNFTFFKDDTINGDQIQQSEHRHLFGYNGSYKNQMKLGATLVNGTVGVGFRGDRINNVGLAHTVKRNFLNDIKRGNIKENNFNAFMELDFHFSEKLTINAGLRGDYFTFDYVSKLEDTTYRPIGKGLINPKVNVYYKLNNDVQLYVSGGYGFHSNDARVSVIRTDTTSLPRAKSVDVGSNFKIRKKIVVNAALWYMFLESEYSYIGDDGFIEPGGSSRRAGMDVSARYQILKWLFADFDITYSYARFNDLPEGENYIPLAPAFTGVGGIGIISQNGFSGSLRFRHLGERPATEDYSVKASGYFLIDAVINYQKKNWLFNISAENILNSKWREAQFATESRLQDEQEPVTENHFTPGSPFYIKGGVSFIF